MANNEVQLESQLAADTPNESVSLAIESSFFYTSEKFIQSLDVADVTKSIVERFPNMSSDKSDSEIKRALLSMLANDEFMNAILQHYGISIQEFIKMLYFSYGALFKGVFLSKVKNEISKHDYSRKPTTAKL